MAWLEELFPDRLADRVEVEFDADRERVMAFRRRSFDGIVLEEEVASVEQEADDADVTRLLVEEAIADVERAFEPSEREWQFIKRIDSLRRWRPELELPKFFPEEGEIPDRLREILQQACWGKRSFKELRRLDLVDQLRPFLNHEQLKAIKEYTPTEIQVPSGKTHRITYEPGEPPVLEVRIQELFGWSQGPRVDGGRRPVLLHLLAPNFRPAQITDDLASFWENTYPEVRKELKARYSKHPWPEEPRTATAVAK